MHNVLLSGNDITGLFFLFYLPKLWGGQVAISSMAKIAAINPDEIADEIRADALNLTAGSKMILAIITAISKRCQYIPIPLVLEVADKLGMGKELVAAAIDRMRRDGDVFEPRPGMIKFP